MQRFFYSECFKCIKRLSKVNRGLWALISNCSCCPIMYIMSFYIWVVLPLNLCAMTLIHPARHICHTHQSRIVNPPHALPDHPAYCDPNVLSLGLGCLNQVVDYRRPSEAIVVSSYGMSVGGLSPIQDREDLAPLVAVSKHLLGDMALSRHNNAPYVRLVCIWR